MSQLKCKNCGEDLNIEEGSTFVTCEYCGTEQDLDDLSSNKNSKIHNIVGIVIMNLIIVGIFLFLYFLYYYNVQSRIDNIASSLMANMVKCPAGTFMMGSIEAETGRENNETKHQVTISEPFYIDKYEVTQKEYEAVMWKNPSSFIGEDLPVDNVDWDTANEFCNRLNKYVKNIPRGYRFDLPSEAQWEYACRAGTSSALNNGKNLKDSLVCNNLDELGWYNDNAGRTTHKVGHKKPNAWGIYDMHGNVMEWCRDRLKNYGADYSTSEEIDPLGTTGSYHVLRGGSWYDHSKNCRSASRQIAFTKRRTNQLGIRLVLVPIEK